METPTRDRILDACGALFRERGLAATGMKEIARRAEAPFGSIYHFFPGGKAQLAQAVIQREGRAYLALIDDLFEGRSDLAEALALAFEGAAETLAALDFVDPCPIATLSLEVASTDEPLRRAVAEVFESWLDRLSGHFQSHGLAAERAKGLAEMTLSALQGGFMLARSRRDGSVLPRLGRQLATLARHGG